MPPKEKKQLQNLECFEPIEFTNFIRNQKCIVCFEFPCDPDHLDTIGMGRDRNKPDLMEHLSCVPLCRAHHIKRHTIGTKSFELAYDVNLWKENHEYLIKFLKSKM